MASRVKAFLLDPTGVTCAQIAAVVLVNGLLYSLAWLIPIFQSAVPIGWGNFPVKLDGVTCLPEELAACPAATECCEKKESGFKPSDTVTLHELMLISFFVPAALLAIRMGVIKVSASRRTSLKFRGNTLSHVLGCVAGVGTTAVVTEYTKVIIGRPRPNYLALQQMEGYETESIKSFPSGHASCSMASLGYMTFIAWGDILSTHRNKSTIKVYMAVPPLILAFWIGLTRIRDYWHHHDDVFAGQALGFLCSYTAYRNLGVLTALGQGEGSGEPLISPTRSIHGGDVETGGEPQYRTE